MTTLDNSDNSDHSKHQYIDYIYLTPDERKKISQMPTESLFERILQHKAYDTIMRNIAATPKEYYSIPQKTMYHNAVSLVVSQRISFKASRQIRKKLYEKHGVQTDENIKQTNYDPTIIQNLDLTEIGIGGKMAESIMEITSLAIKKSNADIELTDISSIKGIGPWTINAIKILHQMDTNIFLSEDSWIRKRLSQIMGLPTVLTKNQLDKFTENWEHKTQISLFLWRLQNSGVDKMIRCKSLTRDDFV
jgi:DNA-3-methyladenine glycosylase II